MWALTFLALASVGLVAQYVCTRRDRRRYLAPGTFVRGLHVRQIGSTGPTVVFEAGIAATCLNWTRVQETLAPSARTFSYDRAGLGWSRPSNGDRSLMYLTEDLRAVLHQTPCSGPFVLVAHSFGTLIARVYAHGFPRTSARSC